MKSRGKEKRVVLLVAACVLCVAGWSAPKAPKLKTEKECLKILKQNPTDRSAHARLAQIAWQCADTAEAMKHLDAVLKVEKRDTLCLDLRARIYLQRQQWSNALADITSAVCNGMKVDGMESVKSLTVTQRNQLVARLELAERNSEQKQTVRAALELLTASMRDSSATIADTDSVELPVKYRIPYRKAFDEIQVDAVVAGLTIHVTIDEKEEKCKISAIEADFMQKNDYIHRDEIVDKNTFRFRSIEIGDISIADLEVERDAHLKSSMVINLSAFTKLGTATLNPEEMVIEIR
ncbi:MAG: hypothetical protein MJZ82_03715 [Paludibacteraceae bacterium]|nr:hypothetical protein [Paludibacteraceae bacterium]